MFASIRIVHVNAVNVTEYYRYSKACLQGLWMLFYLEIIVV